jgi:hypothetical protein
MKNVVFWDVNPRSYLTGDTLRFHYRVQPVRFEAFTAVTMKNVVLWDSMPCDGVHTLVCYALYTLYSVLHIIHVRKPEATGNDHRQNALGTWTEVKTLHKLQSSHT